MIASEFAFVAVGLLLGVAGGAALVIVLRRGRPAPEVRMTVIHDAIPRRGATLASDAFTTSWAEPARGGPADRRQMDRSGGPAGRMESRAPAAHAAMPNTTGARLPDRTSVSFSNSVSAQGSIAIEPERDPALDSLRIQAVKAASQMLRADLPTALATLERTTPHPRAFSLSPSASDAMTPLEARPEPIDETPALTRMLRGDQDAIFAVTNRLAGADAIERRSWEIAIRNIIDAVVARAIVEGWLDFPVGNPFWDTFTVAQCRSIAAALAAAGYEFNGVDGWAESRVPTYRDLTIAVADAGLEPRRIRAWPTQEEIGNLYLEVSAASDEYVASHAPNLDLEELHELVGFGDTERARVWANWDRVHTVLTTRVPTA